MNVLSEVRARELIGEFDEDIDIEVLEVDRSLLSKQIDAYTREIENKSVRDRIETQLWSDLDMEEPSTRCYIYVSNSQYKVIEESPESLNLLRRVVNSDVDMWMVEIDDDLL